MRRVRPARRARLAAAASISRRYDRIIVATFAFVLLLAAGLVAVDYRREESAERDRIAIRVWERLAALNALVRGAVDAVDALRAHAEDMELADPTTLVPRQRCFR